MPKLTPEAVALIKEGTPQPQTTTTLTASSIAAPRPDSSAIIPARPKTEPAKPRAPKSPQTDAAYVAVNFRIPPNISTALLKASSDRKLNKIEPFTQQAIVTEALTKWLRDNGCLPKEG